MGTTIGRRGKHGIGTMAQASPSRLPWKERRVLSLSLGFNAPFVFLFQEELELILDCLGRGHLDLL